MLRELTSQASCVAAATEMCKKVRRSGGGYRASHPIPGLMGGGQKVRILRDRRVRAIAVIASVAVVAGCASAKFIPTREAFPAKPANCAMKVFSSRAPDRAYQEIGIIEGEGMLGKESLEDVLPEMMKQACLAGGDALIITSNERISVSDGGDFMGSSEELHTVATVIVWTDED